MAIKTQSKLKEQITKEGTLYTIVYFVQFADIATYRKQNGDSADSWTGGSGTTIRECIIDRSAQHYIVKYVAQSLGYGSGSSWESVDKVEKNYYKEKFYFDPSWWGIRKAKASDVVAGTLAIDMSGDGSTFTGPCTIDEYIYINQFTPSYKLCPLVGSSVQDELTTTTFPIRFAGQNVTVDVYKIRLLTNLDTNNYGDWKGINPSSNPFKVTRNNPYDVTQALWFAYDQDVIENFTEIAGGKYNMVERHCMAAPYINGNQLYWRKVQSNGYWSWVA